MKRKVLSATGAVAVIVAAVLVGRMSSSSSSDNDLLITPRAVERRTLSDILTVNGEVRRDEILRVLSSLDGRVSELGVEAGQSIEAGTRVFAIDGRASVAVNGDFAFYRTLQVGSEGRDVQQLEEILVELGYEISDVDTLFTEETRTALAQWQNEQGYGTIAAETEETVTVTLLPNPSGYTVGRANSAAFTIVPSEPQSLHGRPSLTRTGPKISISSSSDRTVEGESTTIGFTSDTRLTEDLTIDFSISGTATEGTDYERPPRTVIMPSNSQFTSFDLKTYTDDVLEGDEEIVISVMTGTGGNYQLGSRNKIRLVVQDGTAGGARAINITAGDTKIDEGKTTVFTLRASAAADRDMTVKLQYGGTAQPDVDFVTPTNDQLTIRAGTMSTDVPVKILDDGRSETRETLILTVLPTTTNDIRTSSVPGSQPTASVEIRSGETPELTLTGGGRLSEGRSGSFVIVADEAVSENTSINYQIAGTATPGVDYQVLTGTVIMRAGSDRASITVRALDDDVVFQPTDMLVAQWPVVVGDVAVEVGDQLVRGTPILALSESTFTIVLTVGAAERAELEVGQVVEVDLTVGDQILSGTIATLDESATLGPNGEEIFEGTVQVSGEFAGVDGASVTVDVTLSEAVDVLAVPVASVLRTADGDVVRVVNDQGTITRVPITIGLIDREWAEIVTGLRGDELVIVDVETEGRVAQTP